MVHEHRYNRDIRYGPEKLNMDGSGKNPMETAQLDTLLCTQNKYRTRRRPASTPLKPSTYFARPTSIASSSEVTKAAPNPAEPPDVVRLGFANRSLSIGSIA